MRYKQEVRRDEGREGKGERETSEIRSFSEYIHAQVTELLSTSGEELPVVALFTHEGND